MNEQKHPLAGYQEAFNQNSIHLTAFDMKNKSENMDYLLNGRASNMTQSPKAEITLIFETFNIKATDPDTLFYLMLNALFAERYGMNIKDFENTYPEVIILKQVKTIKKCLYP